MCDDGGVGVWRGGYVGVCVLGCDDGGVGVGLVGIRKWVGKWLS